MTAEPTPVRFGPQLCGTLAESALREWLLADGAGGYAMGTVAGLRTRRYHGLFVLADPTPARRTMAVTSLDPVLELAGGTTIRLGCHEWAGGAVSPDGYVFLESFDLDDGVPRWRWRFRDVVVERTLGMRSGTQSLGVVHRVLSGGPVRLRLEALVTWRDAHATTSAGPPPTLEHHADGAVLESRVHLRGPGWSPAGECYTGEHLRAEADRGLPADEDVWFAGSFAAELDSTEPMEVSIWADSARNPPRATTVVADARRHARSLLRRAKPSSPVEARLVLAADQFVVGTRTSSGPADVVAGYPWFGSWSRDTMTSYEGLFLSTGRADDGARVLTRYADTIDGGMLANTSDGGEREFNTTDATLWFGHAIGRHVAITGDRDLGVGLLPRLDDIVKAHLAGTRFGIRVDDDGLLTQGVDGEALTWMDARVDGHGVTARIGKPVEVDALWLRLLEVVRALRTTAESDTADVDALLTSGRAAFHRRFPAPGGGYLDVVDGPDGDDGSVRPNQVVAAALLASSEEAAGVMRRCAPLLTPLGLRSLSPDEPAYRGRHQGDQRARDLAYHQGTVWPWLLGAYVDVTLTAGVGDPDVTTGLAGHLLEWGLGSVSETADGDAPHAGTGCPFQAWSVAETIRAVRRLSALEET